MKFSIRDLLLVTMIVAVLAAWWVDRAQLGEKIRFAEEMLRAEKAEVELLEAQGKYQESRRVMAELEKGINPRALRPNLKDLP